MIYKLVIYSKRSHSESKEDENYAAPSLGILRSRRIWEQQNRSCLGSTRLLSVFEYLQIATEISKYFLMSIDDNICVKLIETHKY